MPAPKGVVDLVERFERNRDAYFSGRYNETQVRREFIDPLFIELGWDVDNRQGHAEAYKDVIHEDRIRTGVYSKAPDYCFRIGGTRKFFVEAKRPSVVLKDEPLPAYQLRRYAWSAKLPLSILTDFDELAVYDCRVRPVENDKSSVARVMYLTCREYPDRWDELAGIFHRESVLKGSFDTYAASSKKKGTTPVDSAFLHDIENWRKRLASNIALRNPGIGQHEINFAVQRTIDRIVFLRICEDRGLEVRMHLHGLINGPQIYGRLIEVFRRADQRYNSGLFYFSKDKERAESPDELTPGLQIDDKILKEMIDGLYYPQSPYEFAVITADILGQVYEQFLGRVIVLKGPAGRSTDVVEKPEVRKAGGVYYTPTFIVEYIVRHTIGRLLEGKTVRQAASLRVLDPACGSGSFLIAAYQHILDWHRDRYVEAGAEKHAKGSKAVLYEGPGGEWRLTSKERKRILLDHIYGVDIDTQAVEVTKLSLLLKVLEGETDETLASQLRLFEERALPDLGKNIKCGNSLIEPDFYENEQARLLDDGEKYHVNVFDWHEGFPQIMKAGGFDAVIGNPPYIRIQRIAHVEADYLFGHYKGPTSKTDLSLVFLERGLGLAKSSGLVGFICTSQWLTTDYGKNLRGMLADGRLREIVDFGSLPVFEKVSTYPAIFIISPSPAASVSVKTIKTVAQLNLPAIEKAVTMTFPLTGLSDAPWNLRGFDLGKALTSRGLAWKPLKHFGKAYIGTKSGLNEVFVLTVDQAKELRLEKPLLKPYAYQGAEVERYGTVTPDAVLIYPYREGQTGKPDIIAEGDLRANSPSVWKYLTSHKDALRRRRDSRRLYATGPDWYRHLRAGSFRYIKAPKLALKGIATQSSVGLLAAGTAFDGANVPSVIIDDLAGHDLNYILGVLNSKLVTHHLRGVCPPKLGGYTRFSASYVTQVPIRMIDFSKSAERRQHDKIAELAGEMLTMHAKLATARTDHEKTTQRRQIEATDRQIDRFVYELYGLTAAEIAMVEGD